MVVGIFLTLKVMVLSYFGVAYEGWPYMCGDGGMVSIFRAVCISYSPHPLLMIWTLVTIGLVAGDGVVIVVDGGLEVDD